MSDATKQRIMAHMNKDHVSALHDYLVVYAGLSSRAVRDPRMVGLSDAGMRIRADSTQTRDGEAGEAGETGGAGEDGVWFVKFDPPLVDLEGIRPRVIEMAKYAATKRSQSSSSSSSSSSS